MCKPHQVSDYLCDLLGFTQTKWLGPHLRRHLLRGKFPPAFTKTLPFKVFTTGNILHLHSRPDLSGLGYRAEIGPMLVTNECHMIEVRGVGVGRGALNRPGQGLSTITAIGSACPGPHPLANPNAWTLSRSLWREGENNLDELVILLVRLFLFILDDTFLSTHSGVTDMNLTQTLTRKRQTLW